MVSILAPQRAAFILSTLLLSLPLISCDKKEPAQPEPTEPWLKDERKEQAPAARVEFRVSPASSLGLALPTKRTKPAGTLRGLSGSVHLDLDQLQFVSGSVSVDLRQLALDEQAQPPDQSKVLKSRRKIGPELEAELLAVPWTTQAKRWLGLGEKVADQEHNAKAVFTIESARDLSHPRANAGAVRKVDEAHQEFKQVRLVDATVVGTLTLRRLSVTRTIPVRLLFFYRESEINRDTVPELIEVRLRGKLAIPLLEYEVKPRDEAGHVIAEHLRLLDYWVNDTARITGSVQLEKVAF